MHSQVYSNGLSEVILGKAVRAHDMPRDAIVIMTKVSLNNRFFSKMLDDLG